MRIHEPAWRVVAEGLLSRGADKREELAALITAPQVAWPEVVYLADSQYVTPGLWHALVHKDLAAQLPDEAAQYLRAVYEMNRERNEGLKRQLAEILERLTSRGVTAGLIKGAALLQAGIYPDPGARVMTDLDIVVHPEDVETTERAMRGLGYSNPFATDEHPQNHHHLPPFFRAGEFAGIEVHTEPLNLEGRSVLGASEFWNTAEQAAPRKGGFLIPSATHCVLLAIAHSEIADRNLDKLIVSLRALQDVVAIENRNRSGVDWQTIADRMRRVKRGGAFEDFLFILGTVSDSDTLPLVRARLRSRARYLGCRLALRHRVMRKWLIRLRDLSAYRLQLRFGGEQTFWRRQKNRLRVVTGFLSKAIGLKKSPPPGS